MGDTRQPFWRQLPLHVALLRSFAKVNINSTRLHNMLGKRLTKGFTKSGQPGCDYTSSARLISQLVSWPQRLSWLVRHLCPESFTS